MSKESNKEKIDNEDVFETVEETVEETVKVADETDEKPVEEKKKKGIDIRNIGMLVLDYIFIIMSFITSLMLISELNDIYASVLYLNIVILFTPFYALGCSIVFFIFKLYTDNPEKVGISEARRIMVATFFSVVVYGFVMKLMGYEFPHVFYVVGGLLQFFMTLLTRFYSHLTHFSNEN